jgi:hypothetical protein
MNIKIIRCIWGKNDHQFFEKNLKSYHDECIIAKENDDKYGIDNQMVIVWDEPNRILMENLGYPYHYMGESNPFSLNLNFLHKILALEKAMEMYDEILFIDWDCFAQKPLDENFVNLMRSRGEVQIPLYFYPNEILKGFYSINPKVDRYDHYFNMFFYHIIRNGKWNFDNGITIPNAGFIYCRNKRFFKDLLEIQKIHGIISNIEEVCALLYFNNSINSTDEYLDTIEPLVCLGKDDEEMMGKQIILNEYSTKKLNKDIYFIHE